METNLWQSYFPKASRDFISLKKEYWKHNQAKNRFAFVHIYSTPKKTIIVSKPTRKKHENRGEKNLWQKRIKIRTRKIDWKAKSISNVNKKNEVYIPKSAIDKKLFNDTKAYVALIRFTDKFVEHLI